MSKRLEVFQDQVAAQTGEEKNQQQDDFGEDTNLKNIANSNVVSIRQVQSLTYRVSFFNWDPPKSSKYQIT